MNIKKDDNVMVQFNSPEKISNACVQILIDIYKSKVFFSSGAVPYITIKLQSKKDSDILLTLIDFRFCYGQNLYLKSKMIHLVMCKERRLNLCLQLTN